MTDTAAQRLHDRLVGWWYRWTYCTRHGHAYSAYGYEDYCGNCGKDRPDA